MFPETKPPHTFGDHLRDKKGVRAPLPDERTDLVSTNRLGHGWAYQKLANQQAILRAGCKDGCDWLPA